MASEGACKLGAGGIMGALYGAASCVAGEFPPDFAARDAEDIEKLMRRLEGPRRGASAARSALSRGPPERFAVRRDRHSSWLSPVCEAVLGPDYRIVEIGFDIPFPGAANQPWHRDFAVPEATTKGRRLNSLAFNLTAVDTRPEHGPLEIAPGTQWDRFEGCPRGMFPPKQLWDRYIGRAVQKLPQRGDISARSALTIHRGTAKRRTKPAVLVVGVDARTPPMPPTTISDTRPYAAALPPEVLDHLTYRCRQARDGGPASCHRRPARARLLTR